MGHNPLMFGNSRKGDDAMDIVSVIIAIAVPMVMIAAWLIHIVVYWHGDFNAWYHDSDGDF